MNNVDVRPVGNERVKDEVIGTLSAEKAIAVRAGNERVIARAAE